MKQTICILLCSLACLLPVAAATPGSGPDPVVLELAGIRASLDRLAGLLEEAQAGQRTELLFRRLERKEKRLLWLESRLINAREDLVKVDGEVVEYAGHRERFEQKLRTGRDRGDSEQSETRLILEQLEIRENALEKRKEHLELRIRQLEDEVAEQLEEIEFMEVSLEEMLAELSGSD